MQKSSATSTLEDIKSSAGKGPEQCDTAFEYTLLGAGYLDDVQMSFCSCVS